MLPEAVRQPQGQGGAEAVPARPIEGLHLPPDTQGRPVHGQLAQQAHEEPAGAHAPAAAHPGPQRPPEDAHSAAGGRSPAAACATDADAADVGVCCGRLLKLMIILLCVSCKLLTLERLVEVQCLLMELYFTIDFELVFIQIKNCA